MKIGNLRREYMRDNFNRIVSGEGQSLKFIRFISRFLSLSIFAFCVAVLPAYAQSDDFPGGGGLGDGSEPIDARAAGDIQSQTNQERLSLLTNDLMGDQIDLDTGQLRFSATDVSISGNSNLPVQFGRSADRNVTIGWMAAWAPDIPHIRRRYIDQTDDVNGYNPKFKRCSVGNNGLNLVKDFRTWAPQTYFRGMHFVNFGGAASQMLSRGVDGKRTAKADTPGRDPRWATKDYWLFECINTSSPSNEGFRATAPNGDVYTFNQTISKNFPSDLAYPSYTHKDANLSSIGDTGPTTAYTEYTFLSRIEDVHGNWVIYDYVGGKPTVIRSNDGRRIDINWSGDRISSVATNGRAWYYLYPSCSRSKCSRLEVTLPDQRKWEYELSSDVFRRSGVDPLCLHDPNPIATTVKHPSGTTASFTFDVISNGRKNLHLSQYSGDDWGRAPGDQCYKGATHLPRSFNSIAVKTKTLNISDSPDAIWTYDYEQDFGQYAGEPYIGPGPYQGADLPVTKWREVTNPDGTKVKSYINRDFSFLEGQIVKIETRSSNNTLLRTVTTQYQQGHKVGSRSTGHPQGTTAATSHIVSEVLKETLQGSEIFSSSQSYDHDIESATYSYGKPIKQRSWSTIYGSTGKKGTNTTYEHQTTPWILGLTKTVSEVSATGESREALGFTYNSLGQKTAQTRYGQPWVAFTYHTSGVQNGLLESVSDALPTPRTTWARNWKRGVPQEIERPDGRIEKQDVDNNGWLTADHDAKGYITSYAHDSMGRMTLIDPPGSWANTDIEYSFPSEGGATQTITKEQSKTTITYDSMLRPTLERTEALDTQWSSYVNTKYDGLGRVIFKSQPSSDPDETKGVTTTYDGLGRVYDIIENDDESLKTKHRYLSGHKHRIYDPSGAYTQYSSYGYGGPGNKDYSHIERYSANGTRLQRTQLHKNEWGQLYELQQSGNHDNKYVNKSQFFYYDDQQRLCRHYVPEHLSTLYEYDDAGQMVAYAKGQIGKSCGAIPSDVAKVTQIYDQLGRLKETKFEDSKTPDITRTYDANGNVLTLNRGEGAAAVNWSYSYNDLNMISTENLSVDGRNFNIKNTYNSSGHLKSRRLPGLRTFEQAPDGLGRPTQIRWGYGNKTYADDIRYHPNGSVHQMAYGNGQYYSQSLNDRLLPKNLLSYKGANKAIDLTYGYDARGKVTSITDGAVSGNDRSYSYDGLGYLKTAIGPWGHGSYSYDSLGNLRSKKLDDRTVTLTYDDDIKNRLIESVDTGPSGTRVVEYDRRGNVTNLGNLTFDYDMNDQPVIVTGSSASGYANGNYVYDGNLRRVKSVINDGNGPKTIYNIYDAGGALVHIFKASENKKIDYVAGPAGTLARVTNGIETYLHPDHLGSAQAGTDHTGAVKWREQYTPFGETYENPAANDNLDGFTGHIKDSATGLNYMQARYYDPVIGRFLSVDPVTFLETGDPTHFNRYTYCGNNPINCTDPTGMVGVNLDPFNRPPPTGEQVANQIVGILVAVEVGLIAADIIAFGPSGEGIVPAMGVRAVREGVERATKQMVNPKALKATQPKAALNNSQVKRMTKDMKQNGFDQSKPVNVSQGPDGTQFLEDGHHRATAAGKAGIKEIPAEITQVDAAAAQKLTKEHLTSVAEDFGNRRR